MANKKRKTKRRAVRNLIGQVDHYTNTKTVGLRDLTGRIVKRIPTKKAKKRGIMMRSYTLADAMNDDKRKRKKKKMFDFGI